jgi:hypothetical protein
VDEADGVCVFCEQWKAFGPVSREGRLVCQCHRCKETIKRYQNMNGAGFTAIRPHHWHIRPVGEVLGREGICETLCAGCYLKEYADCYPDSPLPQLPDELVSYTPEHAKVQAMLDRPVEGIVIEGGILDAGQMRDAKINVKHEVKL